MGRREGLVTGDRLPPSTSSCCDSGWFTHRPGRRSRRGRTSLASVCSLELGVSGPVPSRPKEMDNCFELCPTLVGDRTCQIRTQATTELYAYLIQLCVRWLAGLYSLIYYVACMRQNLYSWYFSSGLLGSGPGL